LRDPDAALDAHHPVVAWLRQWLKRLPADLERVNGPVSAQVLADDLKAKLGETEGAGPCGGELATRPLLLGRFSLLTSSTASLY
jgi:hypothetical protein